MHLFKLITFIVLITFEVYGNNSFGRSVFQVNQDLPEGFLNVRLGPDVDSRIVATLEEGSYIFPNKTEGPWVHIPSTNIKDGFWINTGESNQYASRTRASKPKVYIDVGNTSIFNKAGFDLNTCTSESDCHGIKWAKEGDELKVKQSKMIPVHSMTSSEPAYQLYYQVEFDRKTGWISSEFVRNTPSSIDCVHCIHLKDFSGGSDPLVKVSEIVQKVVGSKCSKFNDYHENDLKSEPMNKYPLDQSFPINCIEESLNMLGKKESRKRPGFKICKNGKLKKELSYYPPCASENYLKSVHNSFTKVMKCLDIDPKEIFPLFSIESNFAISSKSESGADGLGHFIDKAVTEVNKTYGQYKDEFKKHSAECSKIADKIEKMNAPIRCDSVSVPKNPLASTFYTAILFKENRKKIAEDIGRQMVDSTRIKELKIQSSAVKSKIAKLENEATRTNSDRLKEIKLQIKAERLKKKKIVENISKERMKIVESNSEMKKILNEISLYAHNWGVGGARSVLRTIYKSNDLKNVTYNDFTGPNGLFLKTYRNVSSDSFARTSEKANYVYVSVTENSGGVSARGSKSSVNRWAKHVNKKVGGGKQCSNY